MQCICGKPLMRSQTGRHAQYCSHACRQVAYRQRRGDVTKRNVTKAVRDEIRRAVELVGFGVDTLVLNILPTDRAYQLEQRRVDSDLQAELSLLKQRAQDEEEDVASRFVFDGSPLLMRTKGSEGFNWILHNHALTLAVNRGSKMQLLGQVRYSSEYLWSLRDAQTGRQDISKGIYEVHVFLISIFGDYIALQPSACDLAVDVAYLDLGGIQEVQEHFITRAQLDGRLPVDMLDTSVDGVIDGPDQIRRRWRKVTGLPFGSRNGQVSGLLYDKTHEIKYHSPQKAWFHDLWQAVKRKDGSSVWDGKSPVWRIEVRFKRRALHEFTVKDEFHGIEDAYQLEAHLQGLWSYAVGHSVGGEDGLPDGWLRYVVPTEDTNRSRWPVHPDWQVIQGAFAPLVLPESDIERKEREQEEMLQQVDEELAAHPFVQEEIVPARGRQTTQTPFVAAPVAVPTDTPVVSPLVNLKPYIRKRHYQVNMRRMVGQVAGCVVTTEAWRLLRPDGLHPDGRLSEGTMPDLSDTFTYLFNHVEMYLEEKERDFSASVQKKRTLYSIAAAASTSAA